MSDTAPAAPPAPPAAPVDAVAPATNLTAADVANVAKALAPLLTQPAGAPAAPADPATPTSPVNLFEVGQVVTWTEDSPYDGLVVHRGMVLEVVPDEGSGARSVIGWFDHVSGPIGDHELAEA